MASLLENINQAISDFDGVKAALEESGVSVPYDTDTSTYGDLVRQAVAQRGDTIALIEELQNDVSELQTEITAKANADDVFTKEETLSLISIIDEQFNALEIKVDEISTTYMTKEEAYKAIENSEVSINRLVQNEDDELILNGGSSN